MGKALGSLGRFRELHTYIYHFLDLPATYRYSLETDPEIIAARAS